MSILAATIDDLLSIGNSLSFEEWEKKIATTLRASISHYSWVGFYWVKEDRLLLGAWDGPEATEHVDIAIGEGICGLAARTGETVIVDDVNARSEYLACFPQTKSEIVVPIMKDGVAIGEIDIDSDNPGAFSEEDKNQLERLASAIAHII